MNSRLRGHKRSRHKIGMDVLSAARQRISIAFDGFEKVCVSFSGGKDSTVVLHMVMEEAITRGRRVSVLFIDLEAQYKLTIDHVQECYDLYGDYVDPLWVCLPLHLRNAVSTYEPFWMCWDPNAIESWVRGFPKLAVSEENYFPFFRRGMEFEEFVPEFAEWFSGGKPSAFFVGIRTAESFNRHLAIVNRYKRTYEGYAFTTIVNKDERSANFYPIYDWSVQDVWSYQGKNPRLPYNRLYDRMHLAGLSPAQMRICQPYGDDQRKGLWLFHLIEPLTWAKVVARVNGANGGSLYSREHGNINGYRKISKPDHLTWQQFAYRLVSSMPEKTKEHYSNKIGIFVKWWKERGYPEGIPDAGDYDLEIAKRIPSWRRVCKALLRNDYWCKGLGFVQQRSETYERYLGVMKKRKERWNRCGYIGSR